MLGCTVTNCSCREGRDAAAEKEGDGDGDEEWGEIAEKEGERELGLRRVTKLQIRKKMEMGMRRGTKLLTEGRRWR